MSSDQTATTTAGRCGGAAAGVAGSAGAILALVVLACIVAWRAAGPAAVVVQHRAQAAGAAAQALTNGAMPYWAPLPRPGAPLMTSAAVAPFYPTVMLYAAAEPQLAWRLDAAARLLIAGIGAWCLAAMLGIGGAGRLLAAMAFMLCSFNVQRLFNLHGNVTVLLPWALLTMEALMRRPTGLRLLALTAVLTLQFLGFQAEASAALLAALAVFWLLRVLFGDLRPGCEAAEPLVGRLRACWAAPGLMLAVGIALLLSSVQWVPWYGYAQQAGGIERADLAAAAILPRWDQILGIIWPHTTTTGVGGASIGLVATAVGLGGLVAGLLPNRGVFWLLVSLLMLCIALFGPQWHLWLMPQIPGAAVSGVSTLLAATALGLAMLSGVGLDVAWQRFGKSAAWLRGVLLLIVAAAGVELVVHALVRKSHADAVPPVAATTAPATQPAAPVGTEAMPRAWIAASGQWVNQRTEAADRAAARGFDRQRLVILDREASRAANASARSAPATVQVISDVPGRIRLLVKGGGGWLVLAEGFDSGWTAMLRYSQASTSRGREIERSFERTATVARANGAFVAVPLPALPPAQDIELTLKYVPPLWWPAMMLQLTGGICLVLLLGWGLLQSSGWAGNADVTA